MSIPGMSTLQLCLPSHASGAPGAHSARGSTITKGAHPHLTLQAGVHILGACFELHQKEGLRLGEGVYRRQMEALALGEGIFPKCKRD